MICYLNEHVFVWVLFLHQSNTDIIQMKTISISLHLYIYKKEKVIKKKNNVMCAHVIVFYMCEYPLLLLVWLCVCDRAWHSWSSAQRHPGGSKLQRLLGRLGVLP